MNKISCNMCIDLIPLVHDGVASDDSRNAVLQHLQECPACSSLYEGEIPAPTNTKDILTRVKRRAQMFSAMVMMFGIFYGLTLTSGSGMFYNTMIMPIIGVLGYCLFRWKGLYLVPSLLLVSHFITNALGLGGEYLEFTELLVMTAIYCLIALVGFVIAALLHFTFKKENDES